MMTAYPIVNTHDDMYVRDSMGNLNGPYTTAQEAVLDHLEELPQATRDELRKHVCRRRYRITHWYCDGIIRLAQGNGDHDLYVFIRTDGTVSKPRTHTSLQAVLALKDAMGQGRRA